MAMAPAADPRRRPLSVPAQAQAQAEFPPPYTTTTTTTTTKPTPRSSSLSSSHVRGRPARDANANADADSDSCTEAEEDTPESSPLAAAAPAAASPPPPVPSILQPRVAVVLKVPPQWHSWLFFFRLCSILPAAWWGLPSLLRLLLHFLPGPPPGRFSLVPPCASLSNDLASSFFVAEGAAVQCAVHNSHHHYHEHGAAAGAAAAAASYAMTETMLATIWCFACGYLSFFFTDCLMSRWLIHYTPQATIVRLLSINAVNAYLTLSVLSFTGGFDDPRLLLPGWVAIATTLTVCYHITHQKINIRKETSTSVNVFSIASYITMVVLLVHMQAYQAGYPTMPVVVRGKQVWQQAMGVVARVKFLIQECAVLREEI